jgi:hypothetical protein
MAEMTPLSKDETPCVFVINSNPKAPAAISLMFLSEGFRVGLFASSSDF